MAVPHPLRVDDHHRVERPRPSPVTAPGRAGVLVPADFTRDRELWRWVPDGVSLAVTRLDPVATDDNLTMARSLADPAALDWPTRQVVAGGVSAVLFACTTCTFVGGRAGETALAAAMRSAGAPVALTTAASLVRAARRVGGTRAAVVHPYDRRVGERLRAYLTSAGLPVVRSTGIRVGLTEVSTVRPEDVVDAVRRGDDPAADVVVVSCTELPTYDAVAGLEAELAKPVVTANQAGMWALCAALGRAAVGPGQALLA